MNDRFKFRVWKKAENKMVEGVTYLNPLLLDEEIAPDEAKNYIIMQSTGKKDTNGKLIYENDIVELKAKNGITFQYVVKFKDYCFILEYINGKLKGTKARNFAKQYAQPQRMYEYGYMVIGNIYQNKELLNENS